MPQWSCHRGWWFGGGGGCLVAFFPFSSFWPRHPHSGFVEADRVFGAILGLMVFASAATAPVAVGYILRLWNQRLEKATDHFTGRPTHLLWLWSLFGSVAIFLTSELHERTSLASPFDFAFRQ